MPQRLILTALCLLLLLAGCTKQLNKEAKRLNELEFSSIKALLNWQQITSEQLVLSLLENVQRNNDLNVIITLDSKRALMRAK